MATQSKAERRDQLIDELQPDVEDMLLRLSGVDGRSVLHLLLASIVATNPHKKYAKAETRLAKIEELLFDNGYQSADALDGDEDVLVWMYRRLLSERKNLLDESGRSKSIKGGVGKIAFEAARYFNGELSAKERTNAQAEGEIEKIARRYQEDFFAQREQLRHRYYDVLHRGEENKIVAGVLLKVLEAGGLRVDYRREQLSATSVPDSEIEEFEREMDLAQGIKSPKK